MLHILLESTRSGEEDEWVPSPWVGLEVTIRNQSAWRNAEASHCHQKDYMPTQCPDTNFPPGVWELPPYNKDQRNCIYLHNSQVHPCDILKTTLLGTVIFYQKETNRKEKEDKPTSQMNIKLKTQRWLRTNMKRLKSHLKSKCFHLLHDVKLQPEISLKHKLKK